MSVMKTRIAAATVACAAALATAATAVALVSQDASAGTAPAAANTVPRCKLGSLSAGLHGHQTGDGNTGYILTLTNTGNTSCSLDGYPGLGLENSSQQSVPSHTHWGNTYFYADPGPSLIVLSPGEKASAGFTYFAGTGGPTDSVATYLQVTPPNAYSHRTVPLPGAPVRINDGNLYVTAMARHISH